MRRTRRGICSGPRRPCLCGAVGPTIIWKRNNGHPAGGRLGPHLAATPPARGSRGAVGAWLRAAPRCLAAGGGCRSGRAACPGPFSAGPANHPIRARSGTERRRGGKPRKSCWCRAGRGLLTVLARIWAGSRRGRGMDSVTRGSGIALSVLIATTASVLLLLPGKPAGSWQGPGTPGRVVMASAAATSSSGLPGPRSQPSASGPDSGQPAAGPHPGCRATGAYSDPARAGGTSLRPVRARLGAARPGPCHPPRARRHQHASRRLSRYRGIGPDLP
jgi:hypothetical protein